MHLPVFVEVQAKTLDRDLQVCAKIRTILYQGGISPLPFASSIEDLTSVLAAIGNLNKHPAVFLINTFQAKDILAKLDPLMGNVPAVYSRRAIHAGQSGLAGSLLSDPSEKGGTMRLLKSMTPRANAIWMYGGKSSDAVAQRAAQRLAMFIKDGDFGHLEANESKVEY